MALLRITDIHSGLLPSIDEKGIFTSRSIQASITNHEDIFWRVEVDT